MKSAPGKILTFVFGDYSDVLTPVLRRLFFGNFMSGLGTGMTLSLLLVYLHDIRGFSNTFLYGGRSNSSLRTNRLAGR
jgi:hypothetical protein